MGTRQLSRRVAIAVVALCAFAGGAVGILATKHNQDSAFERRFGVKMLAARLDARSALVDVRYTVLDAEKAAPLLARNAALSLRDEATGTPLSVPLFPKVGALRATGQPVQGRSYFVLFGNGRGLVRSGSRVSLTFGGLQAAPLIVQ